MGDHKRECPVCKSHTNSIGVAILNGEPCPVCGTPAATILEIDATRAQLADKQLKARVEELLAENGKLKAERDSLKNTLNSVRWALEEASRGER